MPAKTILSAGQRAAIFDPPGNRAAIERLYTLGPDDLVQVCRRRRGANRIGYAVQLCYLRHPGRALSPGEAPPAAMLELFGEQVGGSAVEFGRYAERAPTLREHRAEIEAYLGLRPFERPDLRAMLALGIEVATSTDRGEPIVAAMVERLRHLRVVVPAASTLERVALIARAQARRVAHAGLIRDLTPEQEAALMGLIDPGEQGRTGLGWVRDWSEAPTSANFKAVVERLDRVRSLEVEPDRARRIHAARYAVIARVAGIVTAQALRRMERRRRLATMVAFAIELEAALTDAALLMVEKMVGSLFRRADRTRSERLLGEARMLKDTARVHARLGRLLIDARANGRDPLRAIDDRIGWDHLERSVRFAEELRPATATAVPPSSPRSRSPRPFPPPSHPCRSCPIRRPGPHPRAVARRPGCRGREEEEDRGGCPVGVRREVARPGIFGDDE